MNQLFRCWLTLLIASLLTSCGLFDSGVEWRAGPYALLWLDTAESTSIYRELGEGRWIGRVDSTVFAVGWDGRYLVAKQHPKNDRRTTNYFIVNASKDSDYIDPTEIVTGPLTASEFQKKNTELHLPAFSKVLDTLQ